MEQCNASTNDSHYVCLLEKSTILHTENLTKVIHNGDVCQNMNSNNVLQSGIGEISTHANSEFIENCMPAKENSCRDIRSARTTHCDSCTFSHHHSGEPVMGVEVNNPPVSHSNHRSQYTASTSETSRESKAISAQLYIADKSVNNKKPYKCGHCLQTYFASMEELALHEQCHNSYGFFCQWCPYVSKVWSRMEAHFTIHKEYKDLYGHLKAFNDKVGTLKCSHCNTVFQTRPNLRAHIHKHHEGKQVLCELCGKSFQHSNSKTFKRHTDKCLGRKFVCSESVTSEFGFTMCGYKTRVEADFKAHQKIHRGLGCTCYECGKCYPTLQQLKQHSVIHDSKRPQYKCDHCAQVFLRRDALNRHVKRVHWEPTSPADLHYCKQCEYAARVKHDLTKHIKNKHEKKFKCSQCSYVTNSNSSLSQHQLYHQPERKHPCLHSGCYYSGATASQLSMHTHRVHRMSASHQCAICKKTYKLRTHLARHIVVHSKGLPYCCLECGQGFKHHSAYYKHKNLTGHDKDRTSYASIPQDITITYIAEDNSHLLDVNFSDLPKSGNITEESDTCFGDNTETSNMQQVLALNSACHGKLEDNLIMNDEDVPINITEKLCSNMTYTVSDHCSALSPVVIASEVVVAENVSLVK